MKKIFVFLSIFVLCLSGCAEISYATYASPSGEVFESFCVKLDENELNKNGYKVQDVLYEVKSYLNTFLSSRDDSESLARMQTGKDFAILTLEHKSQEAYNKFWGIKDEKPNSEMKTEKSFLLTKITLSESDIFKIIKESEIFRHFQTYLGGVFSEKDVGFSYVQGISSGFVKSNADHVYFDDGIYFHVFSGSLNEDKTAIFYVQEVNNEAVGAILLLTTGFSLVFGAVLWLVFKKTKKSIAKNVEK